MQQVLIRTLGGVISLVAMTSGTIGVAEADSWHSYTGQQFTAYTAPAGKKTASGRTPIVGYVAMHPVSKSKPATPLFPFGTDIRLPNRVTFTTSQVHFSGTDFLVEDTSSASAPYTKYFIDFYWDNSSYKNAALDYGVKNNKSYKAYY